MADAWHIGARAVDARGADGARRALDVAACLVLLPVTALVCVACGPLLERVPCTGRGGRGFRRFRLRTTSPGRDGPRVTRVGGVLRRTHLDALPQLLNVLRGEMSLVGPQPVSRAAGRDRPWHTARYVVRPGMVSAAQVSAPAGATADDRLRLDIAYGRDCSVATDLRILARAATRGVRRWGARRAHPLAGYWQVRGALLAAADAGAIAAAMALAFWIRFALGARLPGAPAGIPADLAHLAPYAKSAAVLVAVWLVGLRRAGAYQAGLRGGAAPAVRLTAIVSSGAYALAALMAIGFLYRELLLSRQVYVGGAALAVAMIAGVRAAFVALDRRVAALGVPAGRVLIAGTCPSARAFAATLRREAPWMHVAGFLGDEGDGANAGIPVLGTVRDVATLHARLRFDTLVLASPRLSVEAMLEENEPGAALVNFCEGHGISLYILAGSYNVSIAPEEIGSFFGMPLIRLRDAALDPLYALVKRVVDVATALLLLVVGLPLWLGLAAAVRLTSRGPLFFTQLRTGQDGRPFRMYKFRSMAADAEAQLAALVDLAELAEPVFKLEHDPRVTRVGAWMRRSGLDEIPQLLNVLRGEMSLVGPRPEEVRLVDRYTPWQRRRLKARPGITGYQQIRNRGGTSLAERVEHDLVYLKHQSMALDLYIICRTPIVLLRGTGITH